MVAASPLEPAGWRVAVRDADGSRRERRYDALVACSGNYWWPRMPAIPGEFEGERIHAQRYRDPDTPIAMRGKRVAVVGIGNTGCELACEIARGGRRGGVPVRAQRHVDPAQARRRPARGRVGADDAPVRPRARAAARTAARRARVAVRARRRAHDARDASARACSGSQRSACRARPANPLDKRASVCDPLLDSLERGAVVARPGIERFEGKEVVFRDGTRERADVVLFATGYHLRYPYLPADLVDTRGDDLTLFLGAMHPRRHDLFIVGVSGRPARSGRSPRCRRSSPLRCSRGVMRCRASPRSTAAPAPILRRRAFNPALYGLAVREELRPRAARRAASQGR